MMNITNILTDRRGNALVLAVLISLALTSVALVSMQRTGSDMKVAGNLSRTIRAESGGEAGLGHGLAQVGGTPDAFVNMINTKKYTAVSTGDPNTASKILVWDDLSQGGYSTALPDAKAAFRIPHVLHDTAARIRQDVAYRVEIIAVPYGEIRDAPGNAVDSDICLHLFDFNAEGGIPTKFGETVYETLSQTDTIVVRSRVRAAVGPGKCQY
jgi:hypothetical protein